MEPITAATTLATIIGLIGDFAAHRKASEPSDLPEFIGWLRTHGHDEVIAAIESNQATSISIKAILVSQGNELREMLVGVDAKLAALLEGQGAFGDLARTFRPDAMLSEQAKHILIRYEQLSASKALALATLDGIEFLFLDGDNGEVDVSEPRFLKDDLEQMIGLNLLQLSYNSKAEPVYHYTRRASALAKQLIALRAAP